MALTNSIGFIAITVILCAAMCNGKNLYDDTELSGPEGKWFKCLVLGKRNTLRNQQRTYDWIDKKNINSDWKLALASPNSVQFDVSGFRLRRKKYLKYGNSSNDVGTSMLLEMSLIYFWKASRRFQSQKCLCINASRTMWNIKRFNQLFFLWNCCFAFEWTGSNIISNKNTV